MHRMSSLQRISDMITWHSWHPHTHARMHRAVCIDQEAVISSSHLWYTSLSRLQSSCRQTLWHVLFGLLCSQLRHMIIAWATHCELFYFAHKTTQLVPTAKSASVGEELGKTRGIFHSSWSGFSSISDCIRLHKTIYLVLSFMGRPKWHMCPVSKHIVWSPSPSLQAGRHV